jgi:hypothetical protein
MPIPPETQDASGVGFARTMSAVEESGAPSSAFPVADWDHYVFIRRLGEGGMGEVYEALDLGAEQPGDLLGPIAQRRRHDARRGDAVEEVLAQLAGGDLGAQIAVRRRAEAQIDPARARGAEGQHLAGLEQAEELGLDRQRELAHLVEEQRASVSRLGVAVGVGVGAGVGAALGPEEEPLGHRLGDGGAVDGLERTARRGPCCVERARQPLFARAGLAGDVEHAPYPGRLRDGLER